MQKRDARMDARKAFYNLPTTAFGRRREIIKTLHDSKITAPPQVEKAGSSFLFAVSLQNRTFTKHIKRFLCPSNYLPYHNQYRGTICDMKYQVNKLFVMNYEKIMDNLVIWCIGNATFVS